MSYAACCKLHVFGWTWHVFGFKLHVACCIFRLNVACRMLHVFGWTWHAFVCTFLAARFRLHVACFMLHGACCTLHVGRAGGAARECVPADRLHDGTRPCSRAPRVESTHAPTLAAQRSSASLHCAALVCCIVYSVVPHAKPHVLPVHVAPCGASERSCACRVAPCACLMSHRYSVLNSATLPPWRCCCAQAYVEQVEHSVSQMEARVSAAEGAA